jgi:hypothetical protein
MANSSLSAHTKSLGSEDLLELKNETASLLRKQGAKVTVIAEAIQIDKVPSSNVKGPNVASKDFSAFQKKYDIDKLLVIEISQLGFIRNYASYIPTGEPKGALVGKGYMVNLASNTYDWFQPVNVLKSTDGAWDEPPKFPGLSNAYFQALELGKDEFRKPFSIAN